MNYSLADKSFGYVKLNSRICAQWKLQSRFDSHHCLRSIRSPS